MAPRLMYRAENKPIKSTAKTLMNNDRRHRRY